MVGGCRSEGMLWVHPHSGPTSDSSQVDPDLDIPTHARGMKNK